MRIVWRSTEPPPSASAITKEQFGVGLFHAIFLCGGILQLQAMEEMERVRERGDVENYRKREYDLAKQLANAFTGLSVFEQSQLMGRYPKLFGKRAVQSV
jgi:hypothetical protein